VSRDTLLSIGLLFLRVAAGGLMAYHGYQKVFGGFMAKMTEGVAALGFPLPVVFAWAAALSELLGGVLVAVGLKTRFAAIFVFITMSVAAFMQHRADPLQAKELAIVFWAIFGAIALTGAGRYSLDRA